MEELNVNQQDNAELSKLFNDYKKSQEPKKVSSEDRLARYFTPRKPKEYFRILPRKGNRPYVEEAHFHVVTSIGSGGKTKTEKIYCPALNNPKVPKMQNGQQVLDANNNPVMVLQPCPLCQKHRKMLATQDQSLKGIRKENFTPAQEAISKRNKEIFMDASKFEAKKFYIIRGIDKGAEKDGVKFWRFKHNFKNQGTLDKLMPILSDFTNDNNGLDFTDAQKGADLSITIVDAEMYGGITYKAVSAISTKSTPLHSDPIIVRQWLEDNTTWRDVFKARKARGVDEHRYLELVAEGNTPYWDDSDQNNKHWVFPNHPDLEEIANTRTANFDADDEDYYDEDTAQGTSNYSNQPENAVNVVASVLATKADEPVAPVTDAVDPADEYKDLPF